MKIGQSSNPVLGERIFKNATYTHTEEGTMSVSGAINKIGILTIILLISGAYAWSAASATFMWIGLGGGFIFALVTIFKPDWSAWSAPLYATFEGLFLGTFSGIYANLFEGIVPKAILLTFSILFVMQGSYGLKFKICQNNMAAMSLYIGFDVHVENLWISFVHHICSINWVHFKYNIYQYSSYFHNSFVSICMAPVLSE